MMSSLLSAIDKQFEQLTQLKALLENELHLISSREPETLMGLLKDKEALLNEIEQQDASISSLFEKAKNNGESTEEAIAAMNKCNAVIHECKYLTQINAKSVEQGQLRLTHLRNLMMELRARESMTYDRSGKPRGDASSKGITA
ncbi:flagellar protein FlgN [Glaciecola sp. MH2013]|uniref:flagella synthesis protein FlgN n=1 Tax=Glaciecola sp. MH2013 TaxID=2785524 RepID=UPI00189E69EE|nr:flagellar export chaperone FlgN [Glaciecola sp. MH2013]MBF7072320.1 flagellar protein FlgN [Glaciecola sp. MH2013]